MNHRDLASRHRAIMPDWVHLYYQQPIALVRGEGRRVWDAEGNEYLDFYGGVLTTMSGHNLPEVVEAIQEQAAKILHSSTLYLIQSQIELAERIGELSGIPNARVFFTNSGSEATDTALLLATAFRRSNQIIALRHSYHGRSLPAIAITGIGPWSPSSLSPFQVTYVQGGYKLRSPFKHLPDDQFIAACVADLTEVLDVATAGDVACMIAEPIQGVGGFITPPDGFFGAIKQVLDEHGILFIADEVQTGWGRTGENFWGIQAHDVTPDILTFAKGIGNGLAIGGLVAREEIINCLTANSISTFGGNPLATAGALANLTYLLDNDLQTNALKVGNQLMTGLRQIGDHSPSIAEVRGKGLMIGIELVKPGGREPAPEETSQVMEETKERGLLIGRGGLASNVLRVAPPLTVTPEEVTEALGILSQSFDALEHA